MLFELLCKVLQLSQHISFLKLIVYFPFHILCAHLVILILVAGVVGNLT